MRGSQVGERLPEVFLFLIFILLFISVVACDLRDLGASIRDQTLALSSESKES